MKKIFSLALVLVFGISLACAQNVQENQQTILKTNVDGFTINIPGVDSKSANAAITEFFTEKGLVKPKTEDKYNSYRAQKFTQIGDGIYDIFFKCVQKGKKKEMSTDINVVVSLGNMNSISSAKNPEVASKITEFMTKFPKAIEKYQLKQKIETLKKEIETANKEKAKTDKEIKKLQEQISKAAEKQNSLNKQMEDASNMLKNFTID